MLEQLGVNADTLSGYVPQKVEEIRAIFAAAKPEEIVVEPEEEFCETDALKTRSKSRRSDA